MGMVDGVCGYGRCKGDRDREERKPYLWRIMAIRI